MVLEIVHVLTLEQSITFEVEQHSVALISSPVTGFCQIGDQIKRAINRSTIFGLGMQ
jgi:hypothetical protein